MQRLRELVRKRDDAYAGVDLANASRIGSALWAVGAALTLVLLPLAHPDAVGDGGWIAAAGLVAGAFVSGARLRAMGARVNVDELLVHSYGAVLALALLTWLSGGLGSPYSQIIILSALYTSAVHPPRRVLPYLAFMAAAALAPLVYDTWNGRQALQLGVEVLIWLALALVALALMAVVRAQRLGLRREGESARRLARVDPLTALLNRRAFDEMLTRAVEAARVSAEPLSVLVGDLDGFKDINDRFGHLEGDRLLRAVAASLRDALRRPDIAYRWGGDEFALILPGADSEAAEHVAERVRAAVSRMMTADGVPLTMATGIAEYLADEEEDAAMLLERADLELLRKKSVGVVEMPGAQG